eukprot:1120977-Pyramimonas_sp.AAC.1
MYFNSKTGSSISYLREASPAALRYAEKSPVYTTSSPSASDPTTRSTESTGRGADALAAPHPPEFGFPVEGARCAQ